MHCNPPTTTKYTLEPNQPIKPLSTTIIRPSQRNEGKMANLTRPQVLTQHYSPPGVSFCPQKHEHGQCLHLATFGWPITKVDHLRLTPQTTISPPLPRCAPMFKKKILATRTSLVQCNNCSSNGLIIWFYQSLLDMHSCLSFKEQ